MEKMLETVKYLIGSIGPSGYGSKSTGDQVTENCSDLRSITAIITGNNLTQFTSHAHAIIDRDILLSNQDHLFLVLTFFVSIVPWFNQVPRPGSEPRRLVF